MTIITILDHELDSDTDNTYDLTIDYTTTIRVLLTSSSASAAAWISDVLPCSVVGIDIEWRPNFSRHIDNPAATLQLCSGHRCLVFQLIHADAPLPQALFAFLADPARRFAGVGVANDAEKLLLDHGLSVRNSFDLGAAAATAYGEPRLRGAGLKELALRVVGIDVQKPKRITMGRWDHRWLSLEQVRYASIDAYASYAIAERLISGDRLR